MDWYQQLVEINFIARNLIRMEKDCNNNFETMTKTDKYFMAKKMLCMLSTILGMILTFLNIIDKLS